MRRFFIGLIVFLLLSLSLPIIGIADQIQALPDSINPHAVPFLYLFYSINIMMSPFTSLVQKTTAASAELSSTPLLSWVPLAMWLLTAFASGAVVGDVGKSFKISMIGVLILMILWLPASIISLRAIISDEVARTILLDRMIAEFMLHRPMDLALVFLVPAISSALGAAVFGRSRQHETELQSTDWVLSE